MDSARDSTPYSPADPPADTDDGRWMTFAELAAARGISKASAIKLVRRHGWRRQHDRRSFDPTGSAPPARVNVTMPAGMLASHRRERSADVVPTFVQQIELT
jgi:hypothetical protein